jgi:hypothetical protein
MVIAIQNSIPSANAKQKNIQKVMICDPIQDRCARVGTASSPGSEPSDVLLTVVYGQ